MAESGGNEAALITSILGGITGGLGSFFGARESKKAFRRFRKRQAGAITKAREFTDERIAALTGPGTLLGLGTEFLRGTFSDPESSPLAESLTKGLRVAQESRGLRRSTIGAVSEARALGAFTQNLRSSLLPAVQQFGTLPETLRQSILGFELPIHIGRATGLNVSGLGVAPGLEAGFASGGSTSAILSGAASGLLGGANIGFGFQQMQQNQQELDALRSRRGQNQNQSAGGGGFFGSLFGG